MVKYTCQYLNQIVVLSMRDTPHHLPNGRDESNIQLIRSSSFDLDISTFVYTQEQKLKIP